MVNDVVKAPYADTAIPLYLSSITGMKYRVLNCLECGCEFLERQGDVIYRASDEDVKEINVMDGVGIDSRCPKCTQLYKVTVSINIMYDRDSMPLHIQPQSVYLVSESVKKLRYMHCLECGKSFQTISDRIGQMVDNRIPFEYVNPSRLGPIQSICSFNKCSQVWAVMV